MKKISIFRAVIFTSIIFLPLITFADNGIGVRDLITGIGATAILIQLFTGTVVKALATLALSVALLAFFYGIIEYIWAKRSGDSGKVKVGGDFIKWSLVALFVMFSVYGIIKLGQDIFFHGRDTTTIDLPSFNFNTKGGNPQTGNQGLSSPGDSLQGVAPPPSYKNDSLQGVTPSPSSNGDGVTSGSHGTSGCPSGQVYDSDTGQCLNSVLPSKTSSCPSGQVYDSDTGQCLQSVLSPEIRCSNSGGSYNNGNCIMPDQ